MAIAQAAEFQDLRFKSGEKSLFKEINKDNGIKFPIKVDIALPAHKVSLLLQSELGGVDFPVADQYGKHKNSYNLEKRVVLQNINRLIRCIVDCQLEKKDAVAIRHALELARSFSAKVWDNSPLQLKQLDGIGNVAVRKLANVGINSIEALETTEAHRLETTLGRHPPFGMKLLSQFEKFPKLRVTGKMISHEAKPGKPVRVKVEAEIGFLNANVPTYFQKKAIFVCFLAEVSDGQLIDFQRLNANKLQNGYDIVALADLNSPNQYITCHVMCDEIAGTMRSAEIRPGLSATLFPSNKSIDRSGIQHHEKKGCVRRDSSHFSDDDIDDGDLLAAGKME